MTADVDPIVIAEIVNRHGDPEAFAERELVVLHNIQALPIGTQLFAVYPRREAAPELWAAIRETLQDVALHGAQAELDEVDAAMLLGLVDQEPAAPLNLENQRAIASLEVSMQVLAKTFQTQHARALQAIYTAASSPRAHLMLDHIAAVARSAITEPASMQPGTAQ